MLLPDARECYCLSCGFLQQYNHPEGQSWAVGATSFGNSKASNVTILPMLVTIFIDFLKGKFLQSSSFAVLCPHTAPGFLSVTYSHCSSNASQSSQWNTIAWLQLPSTLPLFLRTFPWNSHILHTVRVKVVLTTQCHGLHSAIYWFMPPLGYSSEQNGPKHSLQVASIVGREVLGQKQNKSKCT